MKFKFRIKIVGLSFLLFSGITAQNSTQDIFGRLKQKNWSDEISPIDPEAAAYYIFDKGQTSMIIENGLWKLSLQRHFRIKVLEDQGISEGNITLWIYAENENQKENLVELKGITYNLENKKIIPTRLTKVDVKRIKIDRQWSRVDIKMPNVIRGSVIELTYTLNSDFLENFESWVFQKDIPVVSSDYITIIPEYFQYKPFVIGSAKVNAIHEIGQRPGNYFNDEVSLYSMTNIPPFKKESYTALDKDLRQKLYFELVQYKTEGKTQKYSKTWNAITRELLEAPGCGAALNDSIFSKAYLDSITNIYPQKMDRVKAAYQIIKSEMMWNGLNGIYAQTELSEAFQSRSGNGAVINLCLINLLNHLGLDAYPVVLRERADGKLKTESPNLKQLNYLIAKVLVDNKPVLLDAADPISSFGVLSPKALNDSGLGLKDSMLEWVPLNPSTIAQTLVTYHLQLTDHSNLTGTYDEKSYNYAAYRVRTDLKQAAYDFKYFESIESICTGVSLFNQRISNREDPEAAMNINSDIKIFLPPIIQDSILSFIPMQMERWKVSPFKAEVRMFPVEFTYPWTQSVTMEFKIPDDFTIKSVPASIRLRNDDNSADFIFLVDQSKDLITINSAINFRRAEFSTLEYYSLKELFKHIVDKQAEPIVLLKVR